MTQRKRMEMQQQPQLDLQALPEGCIANVIALTSPQDACRFASLSKDIRSAAESDAVWDKFVPPETHTILSKSNSLSSSSPPKSKKELYMALCDNPVLIDDGNMLIKMFITLSFTLSFSLDKWSGKKCYMIAAKRLRIAWGGTPQYWTWISLPESRFKEAAELRFVCWLEIRGRIEMRMLSPSTTYRAYLVYKLTEGTYGLDWPAVVTVGARAYGFDYDQWPGLKEITAGIEPTAILVPRRNRDNYYGRQLGINHEIHELKYPNESRADGWLEMELGEFYCQGEFEMICCETSRCKSGLRVQGIEIRPKRN